MQDNTNKIPKLKNNITSNEFHSNMEFRPIRPKSKYNDKIFNRYWELINHQNNKKNNKNPNININIKNIKKNNKSKKPQKFKQKRSLISI